VLLVLLLAACTGLGLAVVALSERGEPDPTDPVSAVAPVTDGPVAVLRDWDHRRAAAWAAGDVRRLRSLYVARSAAADADAARLQQWVARDLRVRDLTTQVLHAQVLTDRPDRIVLSVTDRIARGVVAGAAEPLRLPADGASTWRITMRRMAGDWLVASVTR
jgi:hypothetical protein